MNSIILTSETIHTVSTERRKGMAIKINISKAYDKLIWGFLVKVLEKFGFDERLIRIIKVCIETPRYLVALQGTLFDFFESKNGIRKGDLVSPCLFMIIDEALSRKICHLTMNGI